jgi:hypothetical protein
VMESPWLWSEGADMRDDLKWMSGVYIPIIVGRHRASERLAGRSFVSRARRCILSPARGLAWDG